MEYRGKHYAIVQGIGPHSSKGKVHLDQKTSKLRSQITGRGENSVVWLIDKVLAQKKVRLAPARQTPARRPFMRLPPAFPISCAFVAILSLGSAKFTFVHFGRNEIPISAWCFWLAVE